MVAAGYVLVRSFQERACFLFSDNFRPRSFFFFFFFNQKSSQSSINRGYTDIFRVFIAERIIYHGRPALDLCTVDRITDYTRLPLLIARQCPVGWIRCTFGAGERGMSEALFSEWGGEKEGGESTVERRGYSRGLPRIDLIWCLPTWQFPLSAINGEIIAFFFLFDIEGWN